jgi:Fe-S-cluster formation regulator IscX/YfhJ
MGVRYQRTLDEKLELFMKQHGKTHFLQDGALYHKSKIVASWFRERPNIKLFDWLGNSPDLNPIENAWSWMKMQLRDPKATNLTELRREVMELRVLNMDDSQCLKNLVDSMSRRLKDVIRRQDNPTKYRY